MLIKPVLFTLQQSRKALVPSHLKGSVPPIFTKQVWILIVQLRWYHNFSALGWYLWFRSGLGTRFSKVPKKSFAFRKSVAKSHTLCLQSCFIHIFLVWTAKFPSYKKSQATNLSVFRTRLIRNGFVGPKCFGVLRETGPKPAILLSACSSTNGYTFSSSPSPNRPMVTCGMW